MIDKGRIKMCPNSVICEEYEVWKKIMNSDGNNLPHEPFGLCKYVDTDYERCSIWEEVCDRLCGIEIQISNEYIGTYLENLKSYYKFGNE